MADKILRTRLCDLLDIEYPIILAGMGTIARAELVAAVSEAGGLGVIGAIGLTPDELDTEIRKTKELTSKPFGVDTVVVSGAPESATISDLMAYIPKEAVEYVDNLAKQIGLTGWKGFKASAKKDQQGWTAELFQSHIELVYDHRVPVFAAGLGSPAFMVPEAHKQGIKVIGVVANVRQARREAEAGVDIIVAQGGEGGGHTGKVGTMPLVPQVVDAVAPILVLAAGGIGDGRGLAAALALGASGVWTGTAFLPTVEANINEVWKQQILSATEEDTRVTKMFTGKTTRFLKSKLIEQWETEQGPILPFPLQLVLVQDFFNAVADSNMPEYLSSAGGQICGLLKELKTAKQVVEDMVNQAVDTLNEDIPSRVNIGSPV
jgi:NAD(P)H-dependent flavin oxidoreductase YrpB (nitropropane dioxygenase family)